MTQLTSVLPEQFVILDTEYTAWQGSMQREWSEAWEARETVQAAAILVGQKPSFFEQKSFSVLVRPVKNPTLSEYFTELTGIKQDDLNHAIPFKDVLNILLDISQNGTVPIYTWGDGDETALRETANIQQVEFPSVLNGMIDIRIVFQELGTSVKGYQSGTIYQAFGLPSPGKAHDALSDVQSIFNSLLHIVERDRTL